MCIVNYLKNITMVKKYIISCIYRNFKNVSVNRELSIIEVIWLLG